MFAHNKRLQYTVRVSESNPGLANLLLEQFGGPQGELAAGPAPLEERFVIHGRFADLGPEPSDRVVAVFSRPTLQCELAIGLDVIPPS